MGPKLQRLTRESMQLNASMNNTIAERFNVGGALVVKLFGKHTRESDTFSDRAGRVRDIGVQTAMYSRMLVRGARARRRHRHRDRLLRRRQPGDLRHHRRRHHRRVRGVREPDLPAAHAAGQRAGRRADRARLVRAGVRGARLPAARSRTAPARSTSSSPSGRVEFDHVWFRHPSAAMSSIPSLEEPTGATDLDDESAWILRDVSFTVAPGELVALVGPSGAGKTTSALLVPRIYDVSAGEVRVDGHDVRDYTLESLRGVGRHGDAGPAPLPRHRPGQPPLRPARRHRRRAGRGVHGRAHPRHDRQPPRRLRHARRRARVPHVGRREAAPGHRPHAPEGPRGRDPRRGDVAPRLRVGAGDPARLGRRAGGSHVAGDRAPALDHRRRRPHPRARGRPHHRERAPRRAAARRRPLHRPVPDRRSTNRPPTPADAGHDGLAGAHLGREAWSGKATVPVRRAVEPGGLRPAASPSAGRPNPSPRGPPVSIVVSPSPRQRWRTTPWPIPTPARTRLPNAVSGAASASSAASVGSSRASPSSRWRWCRAARHRHGALQRRRQPSLAGTIHAGGAQVGARHAPPPSTASAAARCRRPSRCGSGSAATRSPGRSAPRSARSPARPAWCSPTSTRGCRAASPIPGFFDWPDHATTEMARLDPEVVVFIIGTNDSDRGDAATRGRPTTPTRSTR